MGLGPSSAQCPGGPEELLTCGPEHLPRWTGRSCWGCRALPGQLHRALETAALPKPLDQPWEGPSWSLMDLSRHVPLGVVLGPAGWTVAVEGSSDPPGLLASPCRTELSLPLHLCRAGPWGGHRGLGTVGGCRASKSGKAEGALPWLLRTGTTTAQMWRFAGMENISLS